MDVMTALTGEPLKDLHTGQTNDMTVNRKYQFLVIAVLMFFQITVHGQQNQDVSVLLKQRLIQYTSIVPREEIFLHADREEYIAGEEMFLAGYLVDRQTMQSSLYSKIIYIELLNSSNIPVIQKKMAVSYGTGEASMILTDTLSTGIYQIRAYTNWMKNFLPANCFKKEIVIYNLLKDDKPDIKRPDPIRKSQQKTKRHFNSGITFSVDRSGRDSIILHVAIDSNVNHRLLHLIIQTRGNLIFNESYQVKDQHANIRLPESILQPGINQVTLFNAKGDPVAEKLLYSPVRENNTIDIKSRYNFSVREGIDLDISLEVPENTTLSISVSPGKLIYEGIPEYMLTGTEFGIGFRDLAGENDISDIPVHYADSVLAGTFSNWIDWTVISKGEIPAYKFPMEKEYHYLSGSLLSGDQPPFNNLPYVLLSSPGRQAQFQYAPINSKGNFIFPLEIEEGLNDLILMPDLGNESLQLDIESPFIEELTVQEDSGILIEEIPPYVPKWSINYQVRKLYETNDLIKAEKSEPVLQKTRFYGKPDFELILDEYIKLPLMEEIFFEILPNVSIRKKETGNEIVITDRMDNQPFTAKPCLMIDGVIINDPDLIIDMDPEVVERIDVVREKYFVGSYIFPGIVNVITRKADFSAVPMPEYMKRVTYRIIDNPSKFNLTDSIHENTRIPDYRNTLYWNPSIQISGSGNTTVSFSSSDYKSEYIINVQGITEQGIMFSEKRVIRIN